MDILAIFSILTYKDWLIIASLLILAVCLKLIRKLRKKVAQEIHRWLIPELMLELDLVDVGLFLKNEGCLLARDLNIEYVNLPLEDYGFKIDLVLKFEKIEALKPKERIRLKFKAFRKEEECSPQETIKIVPHFAATSFKNKDFLL